MLSCRWLGAAWAAMYQSENLEESARRQQFVRQILSIPDNLAVPMVLGVGYWVLVIRISLRLNENGWN